ncbi:hypothetical protein [uncultured Hyphomicrobium sp.]|uniref:hypothetical protein n=1 Tax=uncultured Hyphomicrobium sp. TaxID=194373 RepID=UPI0025E1644D|nr:hypothetical protein [uncultured Hyphomicrobium sp.]
MPEEITPRPPFRVQKRQGWQLIFDPSIAEGGEATVLGGLKTKNVDVVVTKEGLGPVLAVSCKGAIGAFRNLTNRMEEAVGDCTNLHITYPAMVTGYLFVMRAHRHDALVAAVATEEPENKPVEEGRVIGPNDIAIQLSGEPVEAVVRFHNALRELTGRRGIRNDVSRYEAVSLALVDPTDGTSGEPLTSYPLEDSPLRIERFFETLYLRYDERYVYSAPDLKSVTRRREWSADSPIFTDEAFKQAMLDYQLRCAVGEDISDAE